MKNLILFSSPLTSERTSVGLKVLGELTNHGEDTIVVLIQDATLLASNKLPASPLSERDQVEIANITKASDAYVLREHLARRGFAPDSVMRIFKTVDYDEIVGLIMQDDVQIIGSF